MAVGKKRLPIGIDDFSKVRSKNFYFVDKSLIIRDFLDITKDSRRLFEGIAIMDTASELGRVLLRQYASYFGLTPEETSDLLKEYGLELNYADSGLLEDYWLNTAANFLIRKGLQNATRNFGILCQRSLDKQTRNHPEHVHAALAGA